jgi:alpha-tubulin suppressor-like RCC1 family protein
VGDNSYGQCDVGNWTDIIQVAAGYGHTVGLKSDGTVIAVGGNQWGQCNVSGWTDITQVAAGSYHTVGRKSDGTVVAAGPEIEFAKWNLGVVNYALTISSTSGGSIITPNKGVSTYNAGMVVRLVARPENGYRFVNWAGDIDTVANVDAATTVITMHGDYSITANFEAWVNWALIGGIIGAVVAVGLVIFFVRRRRVA